MFGATGHDNSDEDEEDLNPPLLEEAVRPATGKQDNNELHSCSAKQTRHRKEPRINYNRITDSYPCTIKGM